MPLCQDFENSVLRVEAIGNESEMGLYSQNVLREQVEALDQILTIRALLCPPSVLYLTAHLV